MSLKLQCEDCGWIGLQEECFKKYREIFGEWDVEPYPTCPKCGSENLIELTGEGARLEPVLV